MLIPLEPILNKYKLRPKGVIHVGSHFAQETRDYIKCGINFMVFIEPCKKAFAEMTSRLVAFDKERVQLFNVACGDEEGMMTMNVAHNNEGQSNSLLKPKLHLQQHKEVVFTDQETVEVKRLDNLPISNKHIFDMLVMDVQGFELHVLKGATETLKNIKLVYSEVNSDETYEGNALIGELDAFLAEYGFKRVATKWPSPNWTWGDGIWLRI